MTDTYVDVKIRIFELRGDVYPVELIVDNEQEFRGALAGHILPWISSGNPAQDGRMLFDALFADAGLRAGWAAARGTAERRRLRLLLDAPELNGIPWEALCEDARGAMLAANATTPFSRYLPVAAAWGRPLQTRPLRVLAVIANPDDLEDYNLPALDVAAERAVLETAFAAMDSADVQLHFLDAPATLPRVEAALQEGYHVLHYVGHGMFSARRQQAALYMQDESGMTTVVQEDQLTGMVARQGAQPHLVTLMACQSATRATADAFRGLGPGLVKVGVPAVVAMQDTVAVAAAQTFSQTFYRNLGRHGTVDLAMNAARSALLTAGQPDAAVPVLFMRLQAGRLWAETSEAAPPQVEKPRPDVGELRWYFAELRNDIAAEPSSLLQHEALARLAALEAAITGAPPDIEGMAVAHTWFSQAWPSLAGKVLNYLVLHPITQALMAYVGEDTLAAHRQKFVV